jgi:hypothetical protein
MDITVHCCAFALQAESGDVVMVDVVPGADLTPGSVFMTQVRGPAMQPPDAPSEPKLPAPNHLFVYVYVYESLPP